MSVDLKKEQIYSSSTTGMASTFGGNPWKAETGLKDEGREGGR